MDIKQIRQRIMSEAYDLADRGDHEGYNAIKVMCSDVLELIGKQWVGLTDEEISEIEDEYIVDYRIPAGSAWNFAKDLEDKLKEKNGG